MTVITLVINAITYIVLILLWTLQNLFYSMSDFDILLIISNYEYFHEEYAEHRQDCILI